MHLCVCLCLCLSVSLCVCVCVCVCVSLSLHQQSPRGLLVLMVSRQPLPAEAEAKPATEANRSQDWLAGLELGVAESQTDRPGKLALKSEATWNLICFIKRRGLCTVWQHLKCPSQRQHGAQVPGHGAEFLRDKKKKKKSKAVRDDSSDVHCQQLPD